MNDSITDEEIIEMLAQHLITKPVFDALFEGYSFATQNPMSRAMQGVLDALEEHHLGKEADTLQAFYDSVNFARRASIVPRESRNHRGALRQVLPEPFPSMAERLGIVYTPVEVVDFIMNSVAHVLQASSVRRWAARASISLIRLSAPAPSSRACCRAG